MSEESWYSVLLDLDTSDCQRPVSEESWYSVLLHLDTSVCQRFASEESWYALFWILTRRSVRGLRQKKAGTRFFWILACQTVRGLHHKKAGTWSSGSWQVRLSEACIRRKLVVGLLHLDTSDCQRPASEESWYLVFWILTRQTVRGLCHKKAGTRYFWILTHQTVRGLRHKKAGTWSSGS